MEMLRAGVEDALLKKLDKLSQPFRDARFRPGPVQIGVGFQNVKMIVHGLLLVHVLVAQPGFRAGLGPIAPAHFHVAAVLGIVRVPLDQLKQLNRPFQRGRSRRKPGDIQPGHKCKTPGRRFFWNRPARARCRPAARTRRRAARPRTGS